MSDSEFRKARRVTGVQQNISENPKSDGAENSRDDMFVRIPVLVVDEFCEPGTQGLENLEGFECRDQPARDRYP